MRSVTGPNDSINFLFAIAFFSSNPNHHSKIKRVTLDKEAVLVQWRREIAGLEKSLAKAEKRLKRGH